MTQSGALEDPVQRAAVKESYRVYVGRDSRGSSTKVPVKIWLVAVAAKQNGLFCCLHQYQKRTRILERRAEIASMLGGSLTRPILVFPPISDPCPGLPAALRDGPSACWLICLPNIQLQGNNDDISRSS